MSQIISPEERAIEWRETSAQRGEARERRLHYLAVHMLEELRSEFDLYSGYEDLFVEGLFLLDRQEALFDHEMMTVYQFVGTEEDSGARLLALVAGRLAQVADDESVEAELRTRARRAARRAVWRHTAGGLQVDPEREDRSRGNTRRFLPHPGGAVSDEQNDACRSSGYPRAADRTRLRLPTPDRRGDRGEDQTDEA